jgi:hypothetical protein
MTELRDHLGWRRIPDVVVGRLQQRGMDRRGRQRPLVVEVVAEELGPSLRWATVTTTRAPRT